MDPTGYRFWDSRIPVNAEASGAALCCGNFDEAIVVFPIPA